MAQKAYTDTKSAERHQHMAKSGSKADGTDAAHKLSHEVLHNALDNGTVRGRPLAAPTVISAMNTEKNLYLKTQYGNRELDRRRDERIITSMSPSGDGMLSERTTFERAQQAYKGAQEVARAFEETNNGRPSKQLNQVVESLGNLRFDDGRPGRPPAVKNAVKK